MAFNSTLSAGNIRRLALLKTQRPYFSLNKPKEIKVVLTIRTSIMILFASRFSSMLGGLSRVNFQSFNPEFLKTVSFSQPTSTSSMPLFCFAWVLAQKAPWKAALLVYMQTSEWNELFSFFYVCKENVLRRLGSNDVLALGAGHMVQSHTKSSNVLLHMRFDKVRKYRKQEICWQPLYLLACEQ